MSSATDDMENSTPQIMAALARSGQMESVWKNVYSPMANTVVICISYALFYFSYFFHSDVVFNWKVLMGATLVTFV